MVIDIEPVGSLLDCQCQSQLSFERAYATLAHMRRGQGPVRLPANRRQGLDAPPIGSSDGNGPVRAASPSTLELEE
jgi:hypothetical protein